jgi:S-adenosylmethionine hydrolase
MHVITLTTDFGTRDWFVGTMKGVILGINPRAAIVDLTHEISAGGIAAGAFALAAGCHYFPKGTVHVAVVDPGVGSKRGAIAVQTANHFFVGPDNGVLSWAIAREKVRSIRRLENDRFFLQPISHTFHGRDIFAPVAAHLSRGVPIHKFGPAQKDIVRLPWPKPRVSPAGIEGEVVYIDRFGNAITNIANASVPARHAHEVRIGRRRMGAVRTFYQSVPAGQPVVVRGSSGFLEIAVNGSCAADEFGITIGDRIVLRAAATA